MRHSAESNLVEYLREFESIGKTVLAHESGDPGLQFNEKTEGRKSRETVPLTSAGYAIRIDKYNPYLVPVHTVQYTAGWG
jgi:hypothetical protein